MSSVVIIGGLLACSAIAVATAVGWTVAALASPRLFKRRHSAPTRSFLLAQVRLLPLATVAIVVPAQITAFARHEAGVGESPGALLWTTSTIGLALALHAVWRAAATWRGTVGVIREWKATAAPLLMAHWPRGAWAIQRASPIVAVAGVFRPQLFVARQVLRACTRDELAAIAAHEAAHVSAGDNLIRLLFRLTPGAGLFRRLADRFECEWNAAAEEAADLRAARSASAIDLASALTKVARLTAAVSSQPLVASHLIGGSELQARVHRLLEAPIAVRRHPAVWLPTMGLAAAAVIIQSAPVLAMLHEMFELLVRH